MPITRDAAPAQALTDAAAGPGAPATDARPKLALGLVLALVAIKVALHVAVNATSPYEVHRDELLYFAMGEHLRFWRMDFPPFIAVAANVSRFFGDSLVAVRMGPALAGGAIVAFAALIARELGGGRFAQALAATCVLANVLFLRAGNLFQPVVFDQLWWTVVLYALARRIRGGDARWWLVVGAAIGVGVLTKFSMGLFGVAVLLAVLATPVRRDLTTRWPWIALVVALALGSPSIAGQLALRFPVANQMADLRASQLEHVTPLAFLTEQLLWGPATLVALAGLVALLASRRLRPYRVLGVACLAALLLLMAAHGKSYYAGPVHPTLFAAGAVATTWIAARPWGAVARWGTLVIVVAEGLIALPLGVPVLPPPTMARYVQRLGVSGATQTNRGGQLALPQDYADMLGWRDQAEAVARVWRALPDSDRARAVLIGGNYGQAGAIDFYRRRLGLPRVVSPAGSYWFFGPGDRPGDVVVALGPGADDLAPFFGTCVEAARVKRPWGVEEERDVPIHVCRQPRATLQQVWPKLEGQN